MPYGMDFTVLDSRKARSADDGGERIEAFVCPGKRVAIRSNQRF
jgi:hypothetical protein